MKTKISIVFLIFSLFLTATPFSFAQTSQNDWSTLQKVAAGTDLFVKTSNGKTVNGSLVAVNDIEVKLSVKGRDFALLKDNVETIYIAVPKTGKRARLFGAAVGVIVVLSAYTAAVGDEGDSGTGAPIIPFFAGLLGGTFIGGLFGKGKKKGLLIYKAK